MDITLNEDEQDLSKLICVKDKEGQIKITVGLLVTVFFRDQLTRAVREDVSGLAQDYIELVGGNLRWTRHPKTLKMHPLDSRNVKLPRDWLPDHPDGESWEFEVHGGETGKAASAFQVSAFGSPINSDGGCGYLSMSFPLTWFADRAETFPEFVLRVCKRLRPLSGYGGISVVESPNAYEANEFQPIVCSIAERFPGIEVEDRPGHTNHVLEGIKGVNWLTVLGERWVRELGGIDYLRIRLGESFGFYIYDGGVVIQAGPKAQIGDKEKGRWPQQYVTLARVLKKVQVKDHYPMHFGGPGRRLDHEATKAWLFRFDNK